MAEMTSPGGTKVTVDAHLDGVVAASVGKRAGAHLLDGLFIGIFGVIGNMIGGAMAFSAISQNSGDGAVAGLFFGTLISMIYPLLMLVGLVRVGASPGMQLVGVRWVRFTDGTNPGAGAFGKRIVEALVSVVTLGVGPLIIWFASMDEYGRHWFDRSSDIIAIDVKLGRDPVTTSAPVEEEKKEEVKPWNATASAAADLPVMPPPSADGLVTAEASSGESDSFISAAPWAGGSSESSAASSFAPPVAEPVAAQVPATSPVVVPPPVAAPPVAVTPPIAVTPPVSITPPVAVTPAATSAPAVEPETDRTVAVSAKPRRLVTEDGTTIDFRSPIVVGRAPSPGGKYPSAQPVPIADPEMSVSKTHAAISPNVAGVLVEDMHSTNGTSIINASGEETQLVPGTPIVAPFGSVIMCGSRRLSVYES